MEIVDLSKSTSDDIKDIINRTDKYVLIDFYAFWCEPCIMLNPVLDELANNYSENIDVYRIDVDKNPAVADEYEIENVPTLVLVNKEKVLGNIVGYNSYDKVDKTLQDIVNNKINT